MPGGLHARHCHAFLVANVTHTHTVFTGAPADTARKYEYMAWTMAHRIGTVGHAWTCY